MEAICTIRHFFILETQLGKSTFMGFILAQEFIARVIYAILNETLMHFYSLAILQMPWLIQPSTHAQTSTITPLSIDIREGCLFEPSSLAMPFFFPRFILPLVGFPLTSSIQHSLIELPKIPIFAGKINLSPVTR